ncbi:ANR family transcriptional regulator [Budvicia aquatica]|uniref:ANR family transcriptional regulator n=2 Tax=Budvicia aquatica TaxID=82979 RepID=A0A2C6DID8_9GAMM|nr:ANR family transcriptional regulator [Budvicia aquatica]PHI30058.1 hypothetical protein CRN84_12255 [Budvicia aquatica]VFS49043.1 Uncharacterised protein [Budvicia aquatica]
MSQRQLTWTGSSYSELAQLAVEKERAHDWIEANVRWEQAAYRAKSPENRAWATLRADVCLKHSQRLAKVQQDLPKASLSARTASRAGLMMTEMTDDDRVSSTSNNDKGVSIAY